MSDTQDRRTADYNARMSSPDGLTLVESQSDVEVDSKSDEKLDEVSVPPVVELVQGQDVSRDEEIATLRRELSECREEVQRLTGYPRRRSKRLRDKAAEAARVDDAKKARSLLERSVAATELVLAVEILKKKRLFMLTR